MHTVFCSDSVIFVNLQLVKNADRHLFNALKLKFAANTRKERQW